MKDLESLRLVRFAPQLSFLIFHSTNLEIAFIVKLGSPLHPTPPRFHPRHSIFKTYNLVFNNILLFRKSILQLACINSRLSSLLLTEFFRILSSCNVGPVTRFYRVQATALTKPCVERCAYVEIPGARTIIR